MSWLGILIGAELYGMPWAALTGLLFFIAAVWRRQVWEARGDKGYSPLRINCAVLAYGMATVFAWLVGGLLVARMILDVQPKEIAWLGNRAWVAGQVVYGASFIISVALAITARGVIRRLLLTSQAATGLGWISVLAIWLWVGMHFHIM